MQCQSWSDGEDDHEEDHNSLYDIKYFYIKNEEDYKCAYSWNAYLGHMESGFLFECPESNYEELKQEKVCGTVTLEEARRCLNKEILRSSYRNETALIDAAKDFIASHGRS